MKTRHVLKFNGQLLSKSQVGLINLNTWSLVREMKNNDIMLGHYYITLQLLMIWKTIISRQ